MQVIPTTIPDVLLLEPKVFADERGWFLESYNQELFTSLGITESFVQDNHSASRQGVLRGLHFQHPPYAQGKLVRCVQGSLWDVAVDLRATSPTFKQWFGVELSAENKRLLWIPGGFAHGFYALTDCEMIYKCTALYAPEHDAGILWNDPELAIEWPLKGEPVLSPKDLQLKSLQETTLHF